MLNAFTTPGTFLRGNLHCHSSISDGDPTPARACAIYRKLGYDFISLTDHFRENYGYPVTDTTAYRSDGFTTLLGAELHAPAIGNGEIWHLVANGLPLDFAPLGDGETGIELARRAMEAGAFVSIPHPAWYGLTPEDALSLPPVHAVEAWNTICQVETGRGEGGHLIDQMLNAGRRVGVVAADDTHRYRAELGGSWVMVKAAKCNPDAILAALKANAYYASQGPEFYHIEIDGDHLNIETSPIASAWLIGHAARSVSISGDAMTHIRLPITKFAGSWARLVAADHNGKRAWTNPLWQE